MSEGSIGKTPARCAVCGESVPYAFLDKDGKIFNDPPNYVICTDNGKAYHFQPPPRKDCWGIHTGYHNFETVRKPAVSKPKPPIWRILGS